MSSESLLDARPEEAARRLAIGFVDAALAAGDRLVAGTDPEALHDLRVALRRLRSTMRAYAEVLAGAVPKKRRKALGDLARATGDARDAEVQLAWAEGTAGADAGRTSLLGFLTRQKDDAYAALVASTLPALRHLLPRLRDDLSRYTLTHVVFERPPDHAFRVLLGRLLEAEVAELSRCLHAVTSLENETLAHQGRIHGKRIRYLLEPFKDDLPNGAKAVKMLRGLQELLGELNDLAVRTGSVRRALEHSAQDRARRLADDAVRDDAAQRRSSSGILSAPTADDGDPIAHHDAIQEGLLALLRTVLADKQRTFDRLSQEWLHGAQLDLLIGELSALSKALENAAAPREIERKYLLSALPPHVESVAPSRIDQGYLPGEALIERIRRTKTKDGERYVRTVKLGRGVARIEVEEACGRDVFTKLWSLTVGRRVEKERFAIPEGNRVWEVDRFLDRELFLAEIELESEAEAITFPSWLAPYVVRDVTDEPAYVNAKLAR